VTGKPLGDALAPHADGTLLALLVSPRSARTRFDGVDDRGVPRLRVAAPPVDGAANRATVGFLAAALGLPRSKVRLFSGATSRRKRVLLVGIDAARAEALLAAALRDL